MTQAPVGQAPANSTTSWQSFLNTVQTLGADYFRHKYMDVETVEDDRNIPDQADLRYNRANNGMAAGGMPAWVWLLVGAVGVGALLFLTRK